MIGCFHRELSLAGNHDNKTPMKKLIAYLLLVPLIIVLLAGLGVFVAMQVGMATRSDLAYLAHVGEREGLGAAIAMVRGELFGVDESAVPDPSYGREQVAGRGHAPWVLRGNLDNRPRTLMFALAPGTWAAYDIQGQSLYQVWQGDVRFEGAVFDQRHGPQPHSEGAWYLRDTQSAEWFVDIGGEEIPATVRYLGHEYGPERVSAAMRFALVAGEYRLELTEQPELVERDGVRYFTRSFRRTDDLAQARAGFRTADGARHLAEGTLELPLGTATTIIPPAAGGGLLEVTAGEDLARGETVIAGSDCLGCHAEGHKIAGPAWAQIAGKFRGKTQAEVVSALADSVLEGSVGTWGPVPMPSHPELSREQAEAAVSWILNVDELAANVNVPVDSEGQPYRATPEYDYDVLPRLTSLHPSFRIENLAPPGFEPKVGGMDFRDDGVLVLASWDPDGAVFLVDPDAPVESRVRRIAEGLQEPLGLTVVDNRIFVLQKQELTELIDTDGDEIIDQYRAVSYDWPTGSNFHSFAFGLLHRDDGFYFLLSICVLPGGASCPGQLPTQGKLLHVDGDGNAHIYAAGFRTPNGINRGADGRIYVTDNQGDWLPASKLIRIDEGGFYGSRAVPDPGVMTRQELPPAVWLPQDEVGNSPTQPLQLEAGPYAGQWIFGDVYNGGIKRAFLEEVNGRLQGAAFHFSAGFQAGVNRLSRGPEGAIYAGEVGSRPNWGEYGKLWHGLERLTWIGDNAFEIRSVRVEADGFTLELTRPLAEDIDLVPADILVKQWFYYPNEQYGGPKYDETVLPVAQVEVAADRRTVRLRIPGLEVGHVVYLRLDDRLRSTAGDSLWTAEAWYTLNAIPGEPDPAPHADKGWRDLFDGRTLSGWRNYGGAADAVRKWQVEDGALALVQDSFFPMWDLIKSVLFGGPAGDLIYYREKFRNFELSLQWKIAPGGNSGIFYLVRDESENVPWRTGIEMQVLDNEGHSDGEIHTHRAGDLYDLVAADPETVRPPGEWNDVLIRVKDNRIEHWLNGVRVVSVERGSDEWNELVAASKFADMPGFGKSDSGYIVLQDHGDPVWYRNIRVREL